MSDHTNPQPPTPGHYIRIVFVCEVPYNILQRLKISSPFVAYFCFYTEKLCKINGDPAPPPNCAVENMCTSLPIC